MLQRSGNLGGDICFRNRLSSCHKKIKHSQEERQREDIFKIGKKYLDDLEGGSTAAEKV